VCIRGLFKKLDWLQHLIFYHQWTYFTQLFIKRPNFLGEGGALGGGDPL
jgi:hypothetical protein